MQMEKYEAWRGVTVTLMDVHSSVCCITPLLLLKCTWIGQCIMSCVCIVTAIPCVSQTDSAGVKETQNDNQKDRRNKVFCCVKCLLHDDASSWWSLSVLLYLVWTTVTILTLMKLDFNSRQTVSESHKKTHTRLDCYCRKESLLLSMSLSLGRLPSSRLCCKREVLSSRSRLQDNQLSKLLNPNTFSDCNF